MYQIKALPEDFIVKELSKENAETNGQYAYFNLKKINYSTVRALEIISEKLKVPLKNIGFAGNKDKNAVTEQKISIFRGSRNFENINLNNIELKYVGNGKSPVSLGDLEGNDFTITIRNISNDEVNKIQKFEAKKICVPNFFGIQRFSKNNHAVGKEIIKKNFKNAVELILQNDGTVEENIKKYLEHVKNDYIGALRLIHLKTRKLFVHAYQSYLFNRIATEFLDDNKEKRIKNIQVPIIGFNFDVGTIRNESLKNNIKKILDKEKLSPRDFIISQMPELASEGTSRNLFFELEDLKIFNISNDELNKSKKKAIINFFLPKSCYATILIEFIFHQPSQISLPSPASRQS